MADKDKAYEFELKAKLWDELKPRLERAEALLAKIKELCNEDCADWETICEIRGLVAGR
jgi:hypothetical protein